MQGGGFDSWNGQTGMPGAQIDDFGGGSPQAYQPAVRPGSGGWHWLLTLVAIVIVGLLSFGMAFLTRNVEERPVWMMGLIFMVPTAALMLAAMMVEGATSAMTPGSSRGPQIRMAVIATVATFLVGVICDLIYLQGFKKELPPAQFRTSAYQVSDRLIFVTDPTASMQGDAQSQAVDTVKALLNLADPAWEAGMVSVSASSTEKVPLRALDDSQKDQLIRLISKSPDQGRLYYEEAVQAALEMAEDAGIPSQGHTRVVLLTDGIHAWSERNDRDLTDRCLADNVILSCVQLGSGLDATLKEHIAQTGGSVVTAQQAADLLSGMRMTLYDEQVKAAEIPVNEKLSQDLVRNSDISAKIITFVMLLLEGLSLGVCLSLMLSVRGQFRAQYIISPLMGVLAFVLLKLIWSFAADPGSWWVKEGLCFSLLGVVLMMRNHSGRAAYPSQGGTNVQQGFGDAGFSEF